jgi:hypothetical protein
METYSNQALRVLESTLEDYRLDIPCSKVEDKTPYCGVLGEKKWFVDCKALKDTDENIIIDIEQYRKCQNKLSQLRVLQVKTTYAKKMEEKSQLF